MAVEKHVEEALPGAGTVGRPVIGEEQLAAFYHQQTDRLSRYLARKADRNDADDLLICVFEQFFTWWPANADHANPVASLYQIANWRLADRLRRTGRELTVDPADLQEAFAAEADEGGFDAVDLRLDLSRALGELTEQQRQSLLLRYVADLSVAECAEVLGVGHENMKKILTKARALLRCSPRMETYETAAGVKEVRR